jgi:formylglycine-generating enzyme required for sulfatase activity
VIRGGSVASYADRTTATWGSLAPIDGRVSYVGLRLVRIR